MTVRVDGDADTEKSGTHARMAALTLSRPPVMTLPVNDGSTSTWLKRLASRSAVFSAQLESTSAAAPETCGAAIDVPLRYW